LKKFLLLLNGLLVLACGVGAAEPRKVVFVAGPPSHDPGEHEHRAGCLLLQECLKNVPNLTSAVYSNGWPADPQTAFRDASTIVLYSDGEGGNPFLRDARLDLIRKLMDQGVGLVCLHYAVEPTKEKGEREFLQWLGGCFETDWSVNPTWTPDFLPFPEHSVARGVQPFKLHDEWYFHMRFPQDRTGLTPLLIAVAPASTMNRPDGSHEGNPAVREAVKNHEPQCVAWAYQRPNGGRGFGFTGGHYFRNWGNDNFRKLVLNGILWTANFEVPPDGVQSQVTPEDLKKNLDPKGR
jgi:type 1 glutamine amidotransferase